MSTARLSPGVASLIQHVELNSAGWQGAACRQLIRAVLWFSKEPMDTAAIRHELAASFTVPLLNEKIAEELRTLDGEGAVVRMPSGAWKLVDEERRKCDRDVENAEAASGDAFKRFCAVLNECCATLDYRPTWERFNETFLLPLVRAIGAQTYELMAGEGGNIEWLSILDDFAGGFPTDVRVDLKRAIGRFLDPTDVEVRGYVLRYLNAFFYLEALRLSESALTALTQAGRPEFSVFLDTNFVFSMLDLHENPANEAAEALKLLLGDLGNGVSATMYVLPSTLAEAKRVLSMAKSGLGDLRLTPNLASAGARAGISGIAIRFIQQNARAGGHLDAASYFAPYLGDLIGCLRREGVEVYNEKLDHYGTRRDVVDDVLAELDYEKEHYTYRAKKYEQVEHDVILWHFVRDKRPAALESPANAKYWVVTVDYRFLGFDRRRRASEVASVPVCLHPTNFVQMLQFWFSRSEELDRALLGSIQLPFLFRDFDQHAERVTLKILSVLGRYSDTDKLPEDTVMAVMLNRTLRERIADRDDPEEELALVHSAIVEENTRITKELGSMTQRLTRLEEDFAAENTHKERLRDEAREKEVILETTRQEVQRLQLQNESLLKSIEATETMQQAKEAYSRFVARWCTLPPVLIVAVSWVAAYLLRRYLGVSYALGAFAPLCLGTCLWGWLVRGAVHRLGIAAETRITRLVGFLARTASIILLGAAGSILGALVIASLFR